jgi:hypothetical protein
MIRADNYNEGHQVSSVGATTFTVTIQFTCDEVDVNNLMLMQRTCQADSNALLCDLMASNINYKMPGDGRFGAIFEDLIFKQNTRIEAYLPVGARFPRHLDGEEYWVGSVRLRLITTDFTSHQHAVGLLSQFFNVRRRNQRPGPTLDANQWRNLPAEEALRAVEATDLSPTIRYPDEPDTGLSPCLSNR